MGNAMNDHPYDEQAKYYEERECLMQERIDYLEVEIERLRAALQSIARREVPDASAHGQALVARATLEGDDE